MEFAREILTAELYGEMWPLFEEHYKEISRFHDIKLEPDIMRYDSLERTGNLRVYTARESGLSGYCVFFVGPNAHYKNSLQANQDILFLSNKMRKGFSGYKFIKWCDEQLKNDGVQVVYQHVKEKIDFSPLLKRMGYSLADKIYSRRLD